MFKIIINKITKILVFFILIQPVNADEGKVNKLNQKLSHIAQYIKNEIEKTKDYQINTWKEVQQKNFKNVGPLRGRIFKKNNTIKQWKIT